MIFLNIFLWNCDFIFYFILLVVGLFTNIVFSEIFDNLKEKLNFVAFIYDFLSAVISIFRSFLTYTTYVFVYKANVISVYNWNTIVIKPVQQYLYLINSAFIQLVVYAQIHISLIHELCDGFEFYTINSVCAYSHNFPLIDRLLSLFCMHNYVNASPVSCLIDSIDTIKCVFFLW